MSISEIFEVVRRGRIAMIRTFEVSLCWYRVVIPLTIPFVDVFRPAGNHKTSIWVKKICDDLELINLD